MKRWRSPFFLARASTSPFSRASRLRDRAQRLRNLAPVRDRRPFAGGPGCGSRRAAARTGRRPRRHVLPRALQSGHRETACRLFDLPSICASALTPRVQRFTVARAEATVDGYDVPATIDGEQALFQLTARPGGYRIVDVLADPTSPGVAAAGNAV